VSLRRGEILYAAGQPQFHAYFPTSAIVSLLQVTEAGGSTGFAIAGHEGVVGISLLLGSDTTTSGGSVLIAGQGFRMPALALQEEFNRFEAVRQLLLRYAQALITQITQTAVCSRHHTVDQQVCTWLLHCLDRLADNEIVVTHDALASLLGVRRESVTLVVGHLRAAGLIRCRRGCIEVLDRAGLERRSCECHAVVSKEYARLLPRPSPSAPGGSDDGICATQRST
jgi:CRP-like cAMP-binding protein